MAGPGSRREPNKGGRGKKAPIDWALAEEMIRAGITDEKVKKALGISNRTWARRRISDGKVEVLKDWKAEADDKVEVSMYERACGYSHPDVHISNYQGEVTITPITKHYPPDPTSCIFWLKNRRPDVWRDKQEVDTGNNLTSVLAGLYQAALTDKQGIPGPPGKGKNSNASD